MITLTQLEYIIALDKHGSFSLAAKACHITQPTLSMQIQKLEGDLDIVIFDRTKQPISATPIGRKVITQARIIIGQTDGLRELITQEKNTVEGDVRLGIIPTMAPYLLPLFLQEFATLHPRVRLIVEEKTTEQIIVALKENQLDLGLLATPLEDESLREYPLFNEPFLLYAAKGSDLAKLELIEENKLKQEDLLLLSEGHCMRSQMLRLCSHRENKTKSKDKKVYFESGSIETLCHLVEKGHGFTIIPFLAIPWLASRPGKIIPFKSPAPSREVSIVCHHTWVKQALIDAFSAAILKSLPKETTDARVATKVIKIN